LRLRRSAIGNGGEATYLVVWRLAGWRRVKPCDFGIDAH